MGRLRLTTILADPDRPPTNVYSDADLPAVLEARVRALLAAEAELRRATADLDRVVASCRRHGQHAQADDALKNLFDRRGR